MDLEQLLRTKAFLDEMSASIRNILLARFPEMTPQEKDDIDNEVKLKLWKKAAGGKKIDNLRSYLWRVVYTTALDLLGERMEHCSLEKIEEADEKNGLAPSEILTPDFALQSSELRMTIDNALDLIPERRRTVLRLHLDGKDIGQISSLLSWSENQVRHLLYRGLQELRVKMKEGEKGNQ
jgi:RNA polymerase sigma-70 factor (ECF subfamily)